MVVVKILEEFNEIGLILFEIDFLHAQNCGMIVR